MKQNIINDENVKHIIDDYVTPLCVAGIFVGIGYFIGWHHGEDRATAKFISGSWRV